MTARQMHTWTTRPQGKSGLHSLDLKKLQFDTDWP